MQTIILHFGVHKTGTSTIQRMLASHQNILRKKGVYVPVSLPENHSEFFQTCFGDRPDLYHTNSMRNLDLEAVRKISSRTINEFSSDIKNSNANSIVLSGEDGCVLSVKGYRKLKEYLLKTLGDSVRIRVLIYTREHVDYLSSAVQQNVKGNGFTIDKAVAWHSKTVVDMYRKLFIRLVTVFRFEDVKFVSYEHACNMASGLLGHFLKELKVDDPEGMLKNVNNVNNSLCHEAICLIDSLRKSGVSLTHNDIKIMEQVGKLSKYSVEADVKHKAYEECRDDRDFLFNMFGISYPERKITGNPVLPQFQEFRMRLMAFSSQLSPDCQIGIDMLGDQL